MTACWDMLNEILNQIDLFLMWCWQGNLKNNKAHVILTAQQKGSTVSPTLHFVYLYIIQICPRCHYRQGSFWQDSSGFMTPNMDKKMCSQHDSCQLDLKEDKESDLWCGGQNRPGETQWIPLVLVGLNYYLWPSACLETDRFNLGSRLVHSRLLCLSHTHTEICKQCHAPP